jgi:hypothetical protein
VSNIISSERDPGTDDMVMSNGMTSVFLSVLLLSASDLARTDWAVATVAWLAERDQSTIGLGVVGFDVSELGWTRENFSGQKLFLLGIVDAAIAKHRWDALSYRPNDELLDYLADFRGLIARFQIDACPAQPWEVVWSTDGLRSDRAMCPRHAVYLNSLCSDDTECCLICNDEPVSQ